MRYNRLILLLSSWILKCLASDQSLYQSNINELSQVFDEKLVLHSGNIRYREPGLEEFPSTGSLAGNDPTLFNQSSLRDLQHQPYEGFSLLFQALVVHDLGPDSIAHMVHTFGTYSINWKDSNGSSLLFHVKNEKQASIILQYGIDIDCINLNGRNAEQHHLFNRNFGVVNVIREFKRHHGQSISALEHEIFNYGL